MDCRMLYLMGSIAFKDLLIAFLPLVYLFFYYEAFCLKKKVDIKFNLTKL